MTKKDAKGSQSATQRQHRTERWRRLESGSKGGGTNGGEETLTTGWRHEWRGNNIYMETKRDEATARVEGERKGGRFKGLISGA
jgi:hypothetical protein